MHKFNLNKFFVIILILSKSLSCSAMTANKNLTEEESKQEQELKNNKYLIKSILFENTININRAIEDGANINFVDQHDDTPLIIAVRCDYYDVIKLLLDLGADVNKKTTASKNTALHQAALSDSPKIIKLLLDSGANVNAQNEHGITPLSEYLYNGLTKKISSDVVQLFLNSGADLAITNIDTKENPLDFTKRLKNYNNMSEILKLLEEWQEKHRQTIRKEAGEYLISDLCDMVEEYVIGPIKKIKTKPEEALTKSNEQIH